MLNLHSHRYRSCLAPLLLLAIFLPAVGGFGWLSLQKLVVKYEVKQQMMEGIAEEELTLLTFSKREASTLLDWEHPKEFEYRGQMYDVVKQYSSKDSLYYWCWPDHKESQLNQELAALTELLFNRNPQRQTNKEQVAVFFKSLFFQEVKPYSIKLLHIAQAWASFSPEIPLFLTAPPPCPPPQVIWN